MASGYRASTKLQHLWDTAQTAGVISARAVMSYIIMA